MQLTYPCTDKGPHCINCHDHFMELRPLVKEVIISHHFKKDLKDEKVISQIVQTILDCNHIAFHELHKFEEDIGGNFIFRAKKDKLHYVYCIDKTKRIIFLRSFKNFNEYKKFLEDKKGIKRVISEN